MENLSKTIVRLSEASGSDLSQSIGCAVDINGGKAELGNTFGVITDAYDGGVAVAVFGGNAGAVEVKLSDSVAMGGTLKFDSVTGKASAAVAADGDFAQAIALEAGVADELVSAVLLPPSQQAAMSALYTAKA